MFRFNGIQTLNVLFLVLLVIFSCCSTTEATKKPDNKKQQIRSKVHEFKEKIHSEILFRDSQEATHNFEENHIFITPNPKLNVFVNDESTIKSAQFTKKHLERLRNETKELFYHGWNSYLNNAYPADELRPLSCTPYGPNYDNVKDPRNDVLGNFSITFLDTVDTFIIFNDKENFTKGVQIIIDTISFDTDTPVQVFETTIRALGSLLSLHLYASDKKKGFAIDGYQDELLLMAYDLGYRLLPAFYTESGVPFARINLKKGLDVLDMQMIEHTCTAGAGSPMLEMTLLSKLTGDPVFERLSKRAFIALWERRSILDLLPMGIDSDPGTWTDFVSGIGALIDSFFEYALKGAILFNDNELMNIWTQSYNAFDFTAKKRWFYGNVDIEKGSLLYNWIDSLSAFWPGLQVLAGKLKDGINYHLLYMKLWNTFGSIPERWSFGHQRPTPGNLNLAWYPLRPEYIESSYHLYRATKDPLYLQIGVRALEDFVKRFKVECGLAGIENIYTQEQSDRMESFSMSETLKYLYLLFDDENPIHKNKENSNIIFTTEAHPVWLDEEHIISYEEDDDFELKGDELVPMFTGVEDFKEWLSSKHSLRHIEKMYDSSLLENIVKWFSPKEALVIIRKYYTSTNAHTVNFNQLIIDHKMKYVKMRNVDKFGLKAVDEKLSLRDEICELNPLKYDKEFTENFNDKFVFSPLMSWRSLYEIDDTHNNSLVKPEPLRKIGYSQLELEPDFYLKYCDTRHAQCGRTFNTTFISLNIGDMQNVRLNQIDRLILSDAKKFESSKDSNTRGVNPNDFWAPNFNGVNLKFEKLEINKVDIYNNDITAEFIAKQMEKHVNSELTAEDIELADEESRPFLYRLASLNGKNLDEDCKLWVDFPSLTNNEALSIGNDNVVLYEHIPIVNVFVWQ